MTDLPILYSFRRCPYAMRGRMGLFISGQSCRLREVVLRDKPPELLAASPKGTVPVLVLDDVTVIDESLDIMRWALSRNDPEGWLGAPKDEVDAVIAANDGPFKHHLDRYKYSERHDTDPIEHRTAAMDILATLETRLSETAYLFGDQRSFADIAIFPFIRQFAATDRDWFDRQPISHLQAWLSGHLASKLFKAIMIRPDQWTAGDVDILFGAETAQAAETAT